MLWAGAAQAVLALGAAGRKAQDVLASRQHALNSFASGCLTEVFYSAAYLQPDVLAFVDKLRAAFNAC